METRPFGRLGAVSALSLGGGGIGGVYGSVARTEGLATVRAAVEAGITLLDLAPTYGPGERTPEAELIVGEAFDGRLPEGVRLTTKTMLNDTMPTASIPTAIRAALERSLTRLRTDHVDIFFLHSYVRPSTMTTDFERGCQRRDRPGGHPPGIREARRRRPDRRLGPDRHWTSRRHLCPAQRRR